MPLILYVCTPASTGCRFHFGESISSRLNVDPYRPMAERRHLAFIFEMGMSQIRAPNRCTVMLRLASLAHGETHPAINPAFHDAVDSPIAR